MTVVKGDFPSWQRPPELESAPTEAHPAGEPPQFGGGDGGGGRTVSERIAVLEERMNGVATKVDIADVRTDLAKLGGDIQNSFNKQFIAILLVLFTVLAGLTTTLLTKDAPPAPAQPQPIIITVPAQPPPPAPAPSPAE